jgi:Zn-dependent M16 (insulinase) family peptidase
MKIYGKMIGKLKTKYSPKRYILSFYGKISEKNRLSLLEKWIDRIPIPKKNNNSRGVSCITLGWVILMTKTT